MQFHSCLCNPPLFHQIIAYTNICIPQPLLLTGLCYWNFQRRGAGSWTLNSKPHQPLSTIIFKKHVSIIIINYSKCNLILGGCCLGSRFSHWSSIGRLFGSGNFFFFFVSSLEKAMDFVHGHKVTCFERHDFNSSFENADAWNSICTYNQILYLLDGFILWNFYYSRCWNTHIYFQRVPFGIGMLIFVVF